MHQAHRARGPDDRDLVPRPDLTVGGDRGVGHGGVAAGGADVADEVVVHPAHVQLHPAVDPGSAEHDAEQAAGAQQGTQPFDGVGVGAEVDDVVHARLDLVQHSGGGRRIDRGRLGADHGDARRPGGGQQRLEPAGHDPRVGDHDQPSAGLEGVALGAGVGGLNGRPGLNQGDLGGGGAVRDPQHELLALVDDDPLVDHDVLLQRALEVVAEGGVRGRGRHVTPVGLDQHPLPHAEVPDVLTHGDDPRDRLVARHGRL